MLPVVDCFSLVIIISFWTSTISLFLDKKSDFFFISILLSCSTFPSKHIESYEIVCFIAPKKYAHKNEEKGVLAAWYNIVMVVILLEVSM